MAFVRWTGCVALAGCLCCGCERGSDNAEPKERTKPAGRPAAAQVRRSPTAVPTTAIVVDGAANDWKGVPIHLTSRPGVTSSYKPKTVRVAQDRECLYILFELGTGVRERFDRQVPTGRVSSGALGYLNLAVDGRKYRLWLPTGVRMSTRPGNSAPSYSLMMTCELLRRKAQGDQYEKILEKEYPQDKEWIAIAGKHVELKIPLIHFEAEPDSDWHITFDAF